jgi:hypothetical protein
MMADERAESLDDRLVAVAHGVLVDHRRAEASIPSAHVPHRSCTRVSCGDVMAKACGGIRGLGGMARLRQIRCVRSDGQVRANVAQFFACVRGVALVEA